MPLILLVGQVDSVGIPKDSVQRIDARRDFGGTIKWSIRIDSADQVGDAFARAYSTACSGTPGPVVIELPEDVLTFPAAGKPVGPRPVAKPGPAQKDLLTLQGMLEQAERPLAIVGGQCTDPGPSS